MILSWSRRQGRDLDHNDANLFYSKQCEEGTEQMRGAEQNRKQARKNSESMIIVGKERFGIKRGKSENRVC